MFNVNYETSNQEEVWWESQLKRLMEGKGHHANAYMYDSDIEDFENEVEKVIKDSGVPLKLSPDLSCYRPWDGEPNKLYMLYKDTEDKVVAAIEVHDGYFEIRVFAQDKKTAREICDKVMAVVPVRDKPEPREDLIPMALWQHDANSGAACTIKDIQCPSIEEIDENYPESVINSLKELGNLQKPDELGKIIIFHGPPGSGKTHAVRALAREWANFLDSTVEIVVDPELMLNSPAYIRGILLNGDRPAAARRAINKRKGKKKVKAEKGKPPIRLIVIEDSAELFASECRSTPGFARLLNVTDGIIGQGLRCIFLLTANEELGKIDPAIKRPGRCIQCLEFPALSKQEANDWLENHGCDKRVKDDTMLADLYAIKSAKARTEVTSAPKFGFVPAGSNK